MTDLLEFTQKIKNLGAKAIDKTLLEQIKFKINKFEDEHADAIRVEDRLIENMQKRKYLKSPDFKLYEQKNKGLNKTLVAKVKFPFHFKGERKKSRNINVFLGTTKRYPDSIDDENLATDAPSIVRDYFVKSAPDFKVDIKLIEKLKKELILYRYWKEKIHELELRLNPSFTVARSTNANNVNIYIANVKWGYPTLKSRTPKKYLSCYLGVVKNYGDDPKKEVFKDKVRQFIENRSPVVLDPPL